MLRATLAAGALALSAAAPALACEGLVATMGEGGLRFTALDRDVADVLFTAEIWDSRPHDGAILTAITGRQFEWLDMSAEDFSDLVGTDGNWTYDGPAECDPDRNDLEFTPPEGTIVPSRAPDDLTFDADEGMTVDPDAPGGDPRSGMWRAVLGPRQTRGCPAAVSQALAGVDGGLAGMAGALRRMTFARPFDPNRLALTEGLQMTWVQDSPRHWSGEALPAIFGQIPGGDGRPRMLWTMEVVSPDLILVGTRLELILPPVATAMLGIGSEGCSVSSQDRWERIGD